MAGAGIEVHVEPIGRPCARTVGGEWNLGQPRIGPQHIGRAHDVHKGVRRRRRLGAQVERDKTRGTERKGAREQFASRGIGGFMHAHKLVAEWRIAE